MPKGNHVSPPLYVPKTPISVPTKSIFSFSGYNAIAFAEISGNGSLIFFHDAPKSVDLYTWEVYDPERVTYNVFSDNLENSISVI